MKDRTETPNLVRLSRLGFVNAYLVREDDGLTLVDTMLSGSAAGILAAAERAGAPIARIVLTHAHGDHAGSLDALADRLPGIEIALSAREARLMAGDHARELVKDARPAPGTDVEAEGAVAHDPGILPRNERRGRRFPPFDKAFYLD